MSSSSSLNTCRGGALLVLASLLWGSTFVVLKHSLVLIPPGELLFSRFGLATVAVLPFFRRDQKLWRAGGELGLLLGVGYATQTIGLQYTTVSRSAFLTALFVVFVPVVGAVAGRRSRPIVWTAAAVAMLGVAFLSGDGAPFNRGDAWTLCCAIVWAVYILRLEHYAARLPSLPLTAVQLGVMAIGSGVWAACEPHLPHTAGPFPWVAILYLGLIATALTTLLQTIGQKSVSAAQAAVLYTVEPVWASVFAFLLLREQPGPRGWAGMLLILAAALLTQLPGRTRPRA